MSPSAAVSTQSGVQGRLPQGPSQPQQGRGLHPLVLSRKSFCTCAPSRSTGSLYPHRPLPPSSSCSPVRSTSTPPFTSTPWAGSEPPLQTCSLSPSTEKHPHSAKAHLLFVSLGLYMLPNGRHSPQIESRERKLRPPPPANLTTSGLCLQLPSCKWMCYRITKSWNFSLSRPLLHVVLPLNSRAAERNTNTLSAATSVPGGLSSTSYIKAALCTSCSQHHKGD